MTEPEPNGALSRRRVLAATGAGVASALAGCGYRPGGGDLAWESSIGGGGSFGAVERWFLPTADRLVVVRNQSGTSYDFESEEWYDYENAGVTAVDAAGQTRLDATTERQAVGVPAVNSDSVVVPVEGGRVTAIDREAGAESDDATVGGDTESANATGDGDDEREEAIRWRADLPSALTASSRERGDDGEDAGGDDETGTDDDTASTPFGVRASDALVGAVTDRGIAAFDAETGDRAFVRETDSLNGEGEAVAGALARVAVDGEDVWTVVSDAESSASDEDAATVVRYDLSGDRRADRAVSGGVDWAVAVEGTLVVGDATADAIAGYDRDLERRFELAVATPTNRPPTRAIGGGRLYYALAGAVRAVDVGAGALAWEREDLADGDLLATDADGMYAAESEDGTAPGEDDGSRIVAVGLDGENRWTAPLPDGVEADELFAVDGRLIVVDGGDWYGFRAAPGERPSLLG
ncbi:PQQ-binding-like beta-propeller repeat protein [Halorubrum sp. AD140]|uniref:PQQ-binding-like beta-propeller repeat protein n=1 Tax=Halorubrum sp. AD140 TaxID=3050073 RepID=UPI002ACC3A57|nr:PQQ-binding-like beta-propeller repeat protein [Halorubrum sp. AD140]MDZ5811809.1 PQQ-binding-like beta-propeller repeat protein [Halorubrum sp. AD140]